MALEACCLIVSALLWSFYYHVSYFWCGAVMLLGIHTHVIQKTLQQRLNIPSPL